MKQKIVEPPIEMSCPRCGATTLAAVWPYLKGTLEHGEQLTWRRCASCQTLFSRLTELSCGPNEGRQPVPRDAQEGTRPDHS